MNKYLKEFFHRGLIFGGFGPIIMGGIYLSLSCSIKDFSLEGKEVFIAILSTYFLSFIHAGVSVFNQIESWPIAKSLLCHFSSLYVTYILGYLANFWIPFEPSVVLIFTAIFVAVYFVVWFSVLVAVKVAERKFNKKLK